MYEYYYKIEEELKSCFKKSDVSPFIVSVELKSGGDLKSVGDR